MRMIALSCTVILGLGAVLPTVAAEFPKFQIQEIDSHAGNICYAVTVADVNGDQKPDVVAVTEDAVIWYENPSWRKHDVIRGKTARDNVCIQPHDIDGDGRVDFALGAGWRPPDTKNPSTLQWLGRDGQGNWQVHPIAFEEPTLHRIRWGDVKGTKRKQLVVAALQGRGTKGPARAGQGATAFASWFMTFPIDLSRSPGRSRSRIHRCTSPGASARRHQRRLQRRRYHRGVLGGRVRARPRRVRPLDQDSLWLW